MRDGGGMWETGNGRFSCRIFEVSFAESLRNTRQLKQPIPSCMITVYDRAIRRVSHSESFWDSLILLRRVD